MYIFKLIWLYLTDKPEYIKQKREYLKHRLRLRHMEMQKRVFVQDIIHFYRGTHTHWVRRSYISIDGVIICEYNEETKPLFDDIYHNYYIRHRHSLLDKIR